MHPRPLYLLWPADHLATPPLATCLRTVCDNRDVYFRPDGGGRIIMGQHAHDHSLDPAGPNAEQAESIFTRVAGCLPAVGADSSKTCRW